MSDWIAERAKKFKNNVEYEEVEIEGILYEKKEMNDKNWLRKKGTEIWWEERMVGRKSAIPLCCPKCNRPMNEKLAITYVQTGRCRLCYAEWQTDMMAEGTYDDWIKERAIATQKDVLKEAEQWEIERQEIMKKKDFVFTPANLDEKDKPLTGDERLDG